MTTANVAGITNVISGTPISGLGSYVKILTQTASTSATLPFTLDASVYRAYMFIIQSIHPASDSTNLLFDLANSGSYGSGIAYAYEYLDSANTSNTIGSDGGAGPAIIGLSLQNDGTDGTHWGGTGWLTLTNFNTVGRAATYESFIQYYNGSQRNYFKSYGNSTNPAINANAGQFKMSSGNIVSGSVTQYGILL